MGKIVLETLIQAPVERCFDLSRSVDLHVKSASQTTEKAIAGVTTGLMNDQDIVTWQAKHFGIMQKLTTQIVKYDRPKYFRDSQIQGIFKRFDHDHFFEAVGENTLMRDIFDFTCPLGLLGSIADGPVKRHLENFIRIRNQEIKRIAESDNWHLFINVAKANL